MVICSKQVAPYLKTDFVRTSCFVIDEIVYESRNSQRAEEIKALRKPVEAGELEILKTIISDCTDKYRLLKLYEGNGDALLLATALASKELRNGQVNLFDAPDTLLVTEEKALRRACDDFGIKWLSQASFVKVLGVANTVSLDLEI